MAGITHGSAPRGGQRSDSYVQPVDDWSFDTEVLDSQLPVVLEVCKDHCPPCYKLDPVLEELAREWQGRIKIARLRMDQQPGVAIEYGVSTSPTLLVFSNGEVVARLFGPVPRASIERALSDAALL